MLSSDTDGTELYAEFSMTDDGRLVWTGSGDESVESMEFERVE